MQAFNDNQTCWSRILNIGACQFCSSKDIVDLVDQHSKRFWFGIVPTQDNLERLALCKLCEKMVKEAY
jgi:hypothetical protein